MLRKKSSDITVVSKGGKAKSKPAFYSQENLAPINIYAKTKNV